MATGGHFEKKFKKIKLRIDLKWREMRSKVIFGHPKWLPAAILKKLNIDLKWREMRSKVIFFFKNKKVTYRSEMVRNVIESDFRSSKMAVCERMYQKNKSCVLI